MRRPIARRVLRALAVAVPSLVAATLIVGFLQNQLNVPNPSAVYLVAVVTTAIVCGPIEAVLVAIASALIYNYFFTAPHYTFLISDPGVWLSVVLLLFVGIVVGELAALQRSRAELARAREREARALIQVSRAIATRQTTADVLRQVIDIVRSEATMARVWIALRPDQGEERVVADSDAGQKLVVPGVVNQLTRMPGDVPARWVRVHQPGPNRSVGSGFAAYRVRIETGAATVGAVWALRRTDNGPPDRAETRLLASTADQLGQAFAHDVLAAESQAAEIARQSDALKSALLQSVSHDLRTPLATIRAAAGTLSHDDELSRADRQESAHAIEREVEYLNRMVTNLLDLSRIEAGALRADREPFALEDLVGRTLDRVTASLAGRDVEVDLDAPPVAVDPTFFDEALTNVVDNALKYTPVGTALRISARPMSDGLVRLTVDDAGPGVTDEALPRLFDKFYRAPGSGRGSRPGTGIGLAVARGLIEAMGGRVTARRGELGGLAIDIDLVPASLPAATSLTPAPALLP
jgi:two-component system sensor histidine kinase KdpD